MLNSVDEIVAAFDGSTAIAKLIAKSSGEDFAVSNVSNWKKAGKIPAKFFDLLEIKAVRRGFRISREAFAFQRESSITSPLIDSPV